MTTFLLPLSAENRIAAGLAAGDEVEVKPTLDTKPRGSSCRPTSPRRKSVAMLNEGKAR